MKYLEFKIGINPKFATSSLCSVLFSIQFMNKAGWYAPEEATPIYRVLWLESHLHCQGVSGEASFCFFIRDSVELYLIPVLLENSHG